MIRNDSNAANNFEESDSDMKISGSNDSNEINEEDAEGSAILENKQEEEARPQATFSAITSASQRILREEQPPIE